MINVQIFLYFFSYKTKFNKLININILLKKIIKRKLAKT